MHFLFEVLCTHSGQIKSMLIYICWDLSRCLTIMIIGILRVAFSNDVFLHKIFDYDFLEEHFSYNILRMALESFNFMMSFSFCAYSTSYVNRETP
jgi:hypothetical protein